MLNYLGLHRYKFFVVLLILGLIQLATYFVINELESRAIHQERIYYSNQIKKHIKQSIQDKQKATVAIGLMLSHSLKDKPDLVSGLPGNDIFGSIKQSSDYKNLWFQVVDREGHSLYRSWSEDRDALAKIRPEFQQIIKTKLPLTSISSGRFDLSIKAVVPVMHNQEVVGFVDLISHFNSIQKRFEKMGVQSIVLATEERTRLITRPFSDNRLGPFYIANLEPNQNILNQLQVSAVQSWFKKDYVVWHNYLIVPYELKANDNSTHGYYLSFMPLGNIHTDPMMDVFFKDLKQWVVHLNVLLSLLVVVAFGFFLIYSQKQYYKNILNAENEMVLVTDGSRVFDGNKLLFTLFPKLGQDKMCICDHFVNEKGYLSKQMGSSSWLEYLLENPQKFNQAKILYQGKELLLSLKAQKFDDKRNLSVVVLTDITEIKNLEELSRTDELTRAGNRRAFDYSLQRSIDNVVEESSDLSLLLIDIDHFKNINDTYGHQEGDEVLKHLTNLVYEQLEHRQVFYRIGGEEFAIILEKTGFDAAENFAEKLRLLVENSITEPQITVSIGVAAYNGDESYDDLFCRTDMALYQAKSEGRNRVVSV